MSDNSYERTCLRCRITKPAYQFTPSALKQKNPMCRKCRAAQDGKEFGVKQKPYEAFNRDGGLHA